MKIEEVQIKSNIMKGNYRNTNKHKQTKQKYIKIEKGGENLEVKKEERCGSEETGRSKTLQDAEFDTMQSDDGVKIDLAFIVFIIKMMANFFVLMGNDKHKTAKVEQDRKSVV